MHKEDVYAGKGVVGGEGGWKDEGWLYLPTGLFRASMNHKSASHRSRQASRA